MVHRATKSASPILGILAAAALASCSSGEASNAPSAGKAADGSARGELVVFAAASLTDAFGALADDFRGAHPGVDLKLSFAGSQSLRTQIQNGAEPQIFASANANHMTRLVRGGLVDAPTEFASNELVVVVPAANPAGLSSFADLPEADRIVLAGEAVPAGAYAQMILKNAGADFDRAVMKKVVSRENHVRQSLQKVVLGEADAAIVYATDAAAAGDKVKTIAIPSELNVVASYPIAPVKGASRAHLSALFIDFVRSDAGQKRLAEHGFRPPGDKAAAL